jgi:hypothetical protein
MKPCGSGQRIVEKGGYEPSINLATVNEPRAITWGKAPCPVYCVHCPVLEILSIERIGYPILVHSLPWEVGRELCHFLICKDPRNIPEEYYTRVKMKNPPIELSMNKYYSQQ